jgi:hypothetical protein
VSEKFMVSVDGGSAPRHEHLSFGEALTEAHRLSRIPATYAKKIRILKEVAVVSNISQGFLSNLQILDRSQLISVGELLDLIGKS